jgi:hypothetical protein
MAVRAFGARDDGKAKSDAERASVFLLTRAAESLGGAERRRRARWRLAAGADGIRYRFR